MLKPEKHSHTKQHTRQPNDHADAHAASNTCAADKPEEIPGTNAEEDRTDDKAQIACKVVNLREKDEENASGCHGEQHRVYDKTRIAE